MFDSDVTFECVIQLLFWKENNFEDDIWIDVENSDFGEKKNLTNLIKILISIAYFN